MGWLTGDDDAMVSTEKGWLGGVAGLGWLGGGNWLAGAVLRA